MTRLSVLDQSPVRSGSSPADAIRETLALARRCDELGYTRYWLAEHHSTPALAGSAPEVLIGHVASATSGIRVGSGGVMLLPDLLDTAGTVRHLGVGAGKDGNAAFVRQRIG